MKALLLLGLHTISRSSSRPTEATRPFLKTHRGPKRKSEQKEFVFVCISWFVYHVRSWFYMKTFACMFRYAEWCWAHGQYESEIGCSLDLCRSSSDLCCIQKIEPNISTRGRETSSDQRLQRLIAALHNALRGTINVPKKKNDLFTAFAKVSLHIIRRIAKMFDWDNCFGSFSPSTALANSLCLGKLNYLLKSFDFWEYQHLFLPFVLLQTLGTGRPLSWLRLPVMPPISAPTQGVFHFHRS